MDTDEAAAIEKFEQALELQPDKAETHYRNRDVRITKEYDGSYRLSGRFDSVQGLSEDSGIRLIDANFRRERHVLCYGFKTGTNIESIQDRVVFLLSLRNLLIGKRRIKVRDKT